MTKNETVQFAKYRILLNEIQQQTTTLENMHNKHMKCRNGCDLCCIDFSIFPVEFYYILNELKKINFKPDMDIKTKNGTCVFLKDSSCTIYQHRPIMCRTHGLPLIYTNENGKLELSACELNFTEFDFEEFTDKNTLPQDKFNSKLFLLNREFIAGFRYKKYGEMDLIPMRELAKQIKNKQKVL